MTDDHILNFCRLLFTLFLDHISWFGSIMRNFSTHTHLILFFYFHFLLSMFRQHIFSEISNNSLFKLFFLNFFKDNHWILFVDEFITIIHSNHLCFFHCCKIECFRIFIPINQDDSIWKSLPFTMPI